jgi:cytochrome c oxidase cbb3-type subunit 3
MKTGALINEETVTVLTDASALQSGKAIYDANCIACHANDGGGIVGPNLTDQYWINGGGIKNIFKTIKNGVPAKGMISWQTQLNPNQIQQVASYILSLQGKTPVNPKQPEGEIWKDEEKNNE